MKLEIEGKYTLVRENGQLRALHNGHEWRVLTGDHLVSLMADEIEMHREKAAPENARHLIEQWSEYFGVSLSEEAAKALVTLMRHAR